MAGDWRQRGLGGLIARFNLPAGWVRHGIATVSVLGCLLFGGAWLIAMVFPAFAESVTGGVIRIEVEQRVHKGWNAVGNPFPVGMAARMVERNNSDIAEARRQLADGLPRKPAETVSQMAKLDCICRQKIEGAASEALNERITNLDAMNARLTLFIRSTYMNVVTALTREFRIFTGANALLFGALGLTLLARPRASVQLLLPALVLLGTATIVGTAYLFGQNWLHTIVFGDYVGMAYFAYLGVVLAALADVAFFRAIVTTSLLNLVSSVPLLLPC